MSESDSSGGYVDVPTDLQVALAEHESAMSAWQRLTPRQRQAHVADLESASSDEARVRCLGTLIHDLAVLVPRESRR